MSTLPELARGEDESEVLTDLAALGWNDELARHLPSGLRPARVASALGVRVVLWTEEGPRMAAVRSRATRRAPIEGSIVVGDWVATAKASDVGDEVVVESVLPRRTVFLRKAAGERAEPQAIVANVDRVFVVTSLEGDFNPRRLERYLLAVRSGGIEPVIVLSKSDLATCPLPTVDVASSLAPTVLTSVRTGQGIEDLRAQMPPGTTSAFAGSSGVGKSALVNVLLGKAAQGEGAVRASDKRGRHTTTRRSLFVLPSGGLLVDTPGMRELVPWYTEADDAHADSAAETFADITEISVLCRYRDCTHAREPGCAVRAAVDEGTLDRARVDSFHKLDQERTDLFSRPGVPASVERGRRERLGSMALRKRLHDKGR